MVRPIVLETPTGFWLPANFAVTTDMNARTTGLCDWVGIMTLYSRWPLQATLVKSLVVPNLAWMGWIIFLVEAFVALSLILGAFTRLGGAVVLLVGSQVLAVVTGLADGRIQPGGWQWALVLAGLIGYILAVIALGVGGVLLLRDLFKKIL